MKLDIFVVISSVIVTILGLLGFSQMSNFFLIRKRKKMVDNVTKDYEKIQNRVDNRSDADVLRKHEIKRH